MHLQWKGNISKTSECHTIILNATVKSKATSDEPALKQHIKTNCDWWFLCQSDLF